MDSIRNESDREGGIYTNNKHRRNLVGVYKKYKGLYIASALWNIWIERNNRIFKSKALPSSCTLFRIDNFVDLWSGQGGQAPSQTQFRRNMYKRRDPRRRLDIY